MIQLMTLKCETFGLSQGLHDLLTSGDMADVTLACQGEHIQAHKAVLAACSPHFRSIFKLQPWQHPIVFMQDVELAKLKALVDYMYKGEVTVQQEDLAGLLKLAEALKVTGMTRQEKANDRQAPNIAVQNEMPLTNPPPPRATSPPAKITRHSHNCDVSTRVHSPELEGLPTPVEHSNNCQVKQKHYVDHQSWVPAIETIGTIPQVKWEPSGKTIYDYKSRSPENLIVTQDEHAVNNDGITVDIIKLEEEELPDLTKDQQSINFQDFNMEVEEEGGDSYLPDQQDDDWCEASSCSNEPTTSDPVLCEPSQPTPRPSTAGRPRRCRVQASSKPDKQSQSTAEATFSSRGRPLKPRIILPHDSDSNDGDNSQYVCQDCNSVFLSETSLQRHIKYTHNSGDVMFNCEDCPRFYKYKRDLCKHYRKKHPTKLRYTCRMCNEKFLRYRKLQRHETACPGKKLNS